MSSRVSEVLDLLEEGGLRLMSIANVIMGGIVNVSFDYLLLPALFGLLSYAWFRIRKGIGRFPPGPVGLPIIGNLHQLGKAPHLKFIEWKKKYGPVIGINMGSFRTVVVSDYKLIKEVLQESSLAGRPDMQIWRERSNDIVARGILFSEGPGTFEQRKVALRALREFGYGQQSFQGLVMTELLTFLKFVEGQNGAPISLRNRFHLHIVLILWHVITGQDIQEDVESVSRIFCKSTQVMEENNTRLGINMFFPWFSKHFPKLAGSDIVNSELKATHELMQKYINKHKEEGSSPEYYVGAFMQEMKKSESNPNSSAFHGIIGEKNLVTSMIDLFFAGVDTTANTIHWALLFLAVDPELQAKFQEEIDRVIGHSRLPETADEPKMIYTLALLQELFRHVSIAPLAVFHSAMKPVEFAGYKIPKDTMVVANLYSAHHDKGYWGDPEKFRPERFLAEDGKGLIKHEAFFPFGQGKRVCVGEGIARSELFLFLTGIFQKYSVSIDPSLPKDVSLDPIVSFVNLPQDHKVIFTKRQV